MPQVLDISTVVIGTAAIDAIGVIGVIDACGAGVGPVRADWHRRHRSR
ncbi:hypothetical protein QMZ92_06670 [Streptomyces sp. HNM0645]|nr:hypothetical protein [Streptomyces sp. HNM0645]MDI9884087.1 hypothetical protein [Streptomyces sp. HNM0645]